MLFGKGINAPSDMLTSCIVTDTVVVGVLGHEDLVNTGKGLIKAFHIKLTGFGQDLNGFVRQDQIILQKCEDMSCKCKQKKMDLAVLKVTESLYTLDQAFNAILTDSGFKLSFNDGRDPSAFF